MKVQPQTVASIILDMGTERGNIRDVISGNERGLVPSTLRFAGALAMPFYGVALRVRNRLYDFKLLRIDHLPRPVISVGNITAGGTGKTPVVHWLAGRLRDTGRHVAILSRGYRSSASNPLGDELRMLDRALNGESSGDGASHVEMIASPARYVAARTALLARPEIDVFVMDDGFQHRKLKRDLDIVLLSAPEPFGYGRLLPSGLLREPMGGLRRADAFIFTHTDRLGPGQLDRLRRQVRQYHPDAPVYRTVHAHSGLRTFAALGSGPCDVALDELKQTPFFAFSGIGDPQLLHKQLMKWGPKYVGHRWFPDHHGYTSADLSSLREQARAAGAAVLLTTEKDWVKIADLTAAMDEDPPIWRLDLTIQFLEDDEAKLFTQVHEAVDAARRK